MNNESKNPIEDTTLDTLLQASNIMINGHAMSVSWAGDNTLHFRRDGFDEDAERPYNFGTTEKNLCLAFPRAWMDFANGKYKVVANGIALYYTWEEMKLNPAGVIPYVGFILAGRQLPSEWASRLLSAPRQDTGVFEVDYIEGHLKIVKEMRDSTWTEGEYTGFGGPEHQRNAFNKHIALNMLANGMSVNVHYFPSTSEKYVSKIMSVVDQPLAVRVQARNQAVGAFIVRKTEKRLTDYSARLAEEGKEFVSAIGAIKLANGQLIEAGDAIGKRFSRSLGTVQLEDAIVDEENVQVFMSTCKQYHLKVALIS
jgi:hypothetical protein